MKKLVFIALAFVILGFGLLRIMTGKTAPEIVEEIVETDEVAEIPPPDDEKQEPDKLMVTCADLAHDVVNSEFQTQQLDPPFPKGAPTSVFCGSSTSPQSYYYLYDLEDKILMDYYREALEREQCVTTGTQLAPDDRIYMYSLPFTCTFGRGIVATYRDMNAYVITFR